MPRSVRTEIWTNNPEIRALWQAGVPLADILKRFGREGWSTTNIFGAIDPTPQPLGCREPCAIAGESGEQRAFRRFPINSHKQGED